MPRALLAAAALAVVAGVWLVRAPFGGPPVRPVRLSLDLPTPLTWSRDYPSPFAVAPDGSVIVIEALEGETRRLYVRHLGDPAVRALAGTEDAWQPFFSPDGTWVGFFADRKLGKVRVAGGPVLWLADVGSNPRGAAWSADGTIVVATTQTSGLLRIPERGGPPVQLTTVDSARGEYSHRWPEVVPGSEWVMFTVGLEDASFDEGRIEAASLETGERRLLVAGAGFARYVPGRGLVFVRGGRLHAVGFDPDHATVSGTPELVLDAVRYDRRNGGSHLAVSASGVVVYAPGEPTSPDYYLTWIDAYGGLTRAVDTPRPFRDVQASPEGRRIAAVVGPSTDSDVWIVDANATLSRLSFGLAPHRPTWTADGKGITVGAERDRRWRLLTLPADGAGEPRVLLEGARRLYPNSWSPDGRYLVFQERRPDTGWDLQVLEVDASGRPTGPPTPLATSPFHESTAAISPDGRWVAYESDEIDGVVQVYIRSFPDGANKLRTSSEGARWPDWDRAGNLYFLRTGEGGLRRIRTREEQGRLVLSPPEPVWGSAHAKATSRLAITVAGGRYGIDRPAERFVALENPSVGSTPRFSSPVVVFDWASSRVR
jgi:serine/threonine-protein kinase